jgi:hypothetical protein
MVKSLSVLLCYTLGSSANQQMAAYDGTIQPNSCGPRKLLLAHSTKHVLMIRKTSFGSVDGPV